MNMSYRRFRNTRDDLDRCIEALENREIESKEEKRAAKIMIENLLLWCVNEGIIEDYKENRITEVIEECGESEEDLDED